MDLNNALGSERTFWPFSKWQASWQAIRQRRPKPLRAAVYPSFTRKRLTSITRLRKSSAGASSAVPLSMRWHSRIAEPQPAAFVTMASTSEGNDRRLRRAKACAAARSPVCYASPPQQPWPSGTSTSTPLRLRTAIVAVLMSGARTCCAQLSKSATRARRWPCDRLVHTSPGDERQARVAAPTDQRDDFRLGFRQSHGQRLRAKSGQGITLVSGERFGLCQQPFGRQHLSQPA
jgi:hypothetical protein